MNEEKINQILLNQKDIMIWVHGMKSGKPFHDGFFAKRIEETDDLLYPEQEPPLTDKTEKALGRRVRR